MTIRLTPSATWRPSRAAAASRRSLIRPFVHDPTNTTSTFWPMIGWPGRRSMYSRARSSARRADGSALVVGGGDARRDRDTHARVRAVGDHRLEGVGIDRDRLVEGRAVIGGQPPPAVERDVPVGALRGVGPAVDVLEGRVVGGDQAGPGAALDAHVADGHALFHGQRPDGVAAVLEDMTGAAAHADPGQQREDDVLGADARRPAGHRSGPRTSSGRAGAGSGSPGPSRPRSCRCRRPGPRTHRGCSCASRHTRSSCPAGSGPSAGR